MLNEAEDNFQRAYEVAASIEENIETLKDKELKEQASELLEMFEERKALVDSFCDNYQHQLKLLVSFYEDLNDDEWSHEDLEVEEDRIDKINNRNQVLEDVIGQLNQNTEQYQAVKDNYYEMVEMD